MKNKTKNGIALMKLIIFLILFMGILFVANKVLILKDGIIKYERFYDEDSQFDILFFGSSRVLDAFQPMELWDEYGIRSYNMAQHGEGLARDYWQLKNALEYNVPRLVVMDVSLFYGEYTVSEEDQEGRAYLHKQIDHIPMSITKYETIKELTPRSLNAEYIFPFVLYHSRWNQVGISDFLHVTDARLGAEVRTHIMPQDRILWTDDSLSEVFMPESINLDKIISLCKDKNVPLLFICMPCNENAGVFPTLNNFDAYFVENGVCYLNISKEEDFLNYMVDFSDESHVNVAGSLKLTNYIGSYFSKHFGIGITDKATATRWNDMLSEYKSVKDDMILSAKNSPNTLLMLTYADNDYVVEIRANEKALERNDVRSFFPNVEQNEKEEKFQIYIYRKGESEPFVVYIEGNEQ